MKFDEKTIKILYELYSFTIFSKIKKSGRYVLDAIKEKDLTDPSNFIGPKRLNYL